MGRGRKWPGKTRRGPHRRRSPDTDARRRTRYQSRLDRYSDDRARGSCLMHGPWHWRSPGQGRHPTKRPSTNNSGQRNTDRFIRFTHLSQAWLSGAHVKDRADHSHAGSAGMLGRRFDVRNDRTEEKVVKGSALKFLSFCYFVIVVTSVWVKSRPRWTFCSRAIAFVTR